MIGANHFKQLIKKWQMRYETVTGKYLTRQFLFRRGVTLPVAVFSNSSATISGATSQSPVCVTGDTLETDLLYVSGTICCLHTIGDSSSCSSLPSAKRFWRPGANMQWGGSAPADTQWTNVQVVQHWILDRIEPRNIWDANMVDPEGEWKSTMVSRKGVLNTGIATVCPLVLENQHSVVGPHRLETWGDN